MADVSPRGRVRARLRRVGRAVASGEAGTDGDRSGASARGRPSRSRGQLFLVGALALAVVLVALALVLNTAIYAENLATRESEIAGANDATQFREDVVGGTGEVVEYVNRNRSRATYAERKADFDDNLSVWNNRSAAFLATKGSLSGVAPGPGRRGTLVADNNSTTALTDRDGSPDWTVARDSKARGVRFRLQNSSVPVCSDSAIRDLLGLLGGCDATYLTVDGPGGEYRVAFYRDDDDGDRFAAKVNDVSAGTFATCRGTGGNVTVDVTGGQVDSRRCAALDPVAASDGTTVTVTNGDEAVGTYRMVFDRFEPVHRAQVDRANYGSRCTTPGTTFDDPAAGTPYTTEVVYAVNTTVEYRSPDLAYDTTVRAAPGERGAPAAKPYFDAFAVTDSSGGDGTIEVSWTVADPNDDFDSLTLDVDNVDDSEDVLDSTYTAASNTVTVSDSDADGDTLRVTVTLSDDAGHTRTVVQDHNDDGSVCP